jgi:putative tRNA adenosine deaminase-associated protein
VVAPEQVGTDPVDPVDPVDETDEVDEIDEVDVAVVAFRAGGSWQVEELPDQVLESLDDLVIELRRRAVEVETAGPVGAPGALGALGLLSVGEDFALLVRVDGRRVRLLLSDGDAAADWTLARDAVRHLGVREEPRGRQQAVGDLDLLLDLGVRPELLEELLEEDELFPEEVLSDVADALGFGEAFDEVAGLEQ